MKIKLLCVTLTALSISAAALSQSSSPLAVTDEQVGDADSFGRTLKWMGLAQSSVELRQDCTTAPPESRCVTLRPAPQITTFDERDLDSITLPGNSTHSLLCHWVSPVISYSLFNPDLQAFARARVVASPAIRIESDVLNDARLINPITGQPFGGFIDTVLPGTHVEDRVLEPLERVRVASTTETRVCIGATVSRRTLTATFGLSDAQVTKIFAGPITLRFGIQGNAELMEDGGLVIFGVRFVGD